MQVEGKTTLIHDKDVEAILSLLTTPATLAEQGVETQYLVTGETQKLPPEGKRSVVYLLRPSVDSIQQVIRHVLFFLELPKKERPVQQHIFCVPRTTQLCRKVSNLLTSLPLTYFLSH